MLQTKYFYLLALIILIIIFTVIYNLNVPTEIIPTYVVTRNDFIVSVSAIGELRAKNSLSVTAPRLRGNLKIIDLIQEGTQVKKGDVLVKFDPTEAFMKIQEAESQLEMSLSEKKKILANHKSVNSQMQSKLKSSELNYELSKLSLSQMKFEAEIKQKEALLQHKKNELNYEQNIEELKSKEIIQMSELERIDVEIKQKKNILIEAKKDLEKLTLTAPTAGLVVYAQNWNNQGRKFTIGDQPWSGAVIIKLPDLSLMESRTFINEVEISKVRRNQNVLIKLDAFQDSNYTGEISSVSSIGNNYNNSQNIKVFEVLIDIKEKSKILKPGMTTNNLIIVDEIPNVLYLPKVAIFEKNNRLVVFVKKRNSFHEVEVILGKKNEDYAILMSGLHEGDEISLTDPTIHENEFDYQSSKEND